MMLAQVRPFVLLCVVLLSIKDCNSLFAGTITRIDAIQFGDRVGSSSAIVAPPHATGRNTGLDDIRVEPSPTPAVAGDEDSTLHCDSLPTTPNNSTRPAGFKDIHSGHNPIPAAPQPSDPGGDNNARSMGPMPTNTYRNKPVALHICFADSAELKPSLYSHIFVNASSDPRSSRLFRPPRAIEL